MKKLIRPNIDYNKCNAYSGSAYLYAAIKVDGRPILATNINSAIDLEFSPNELGGIIVFSQDVNAVKMSENKLINWLKQKFATFKNRATGKSTIDKIARDNELVGWTVGNFLNGRYTGKNGKTYSEKSLSVEVVGVSDEKLQKIAEELCRAFNQETVLVKTYSERNRILFVNGD